MIAIEECPPLARGAVQQRESISCVGVRSYSRLPEWLRRCQARNRDDGGNLDPPRKTGTPAGGAGGSEPPRGPGRPVVQIPPELGDGMLLYDLDTAFCRRVIVRCDQLQFVVEQIEACCQHPTKDGWCFPPMILDSEDDLGVVVLPQTSPEPYGPFQTGPGGFDFSAPGAVERWPEYVQWLRDAGVKTFPDVLPEPFRQFQCTPTLVYGGALRFPGPFEAGFCWERYIQTAKDVLAMLSPAVLARWTVGYNIEDDKNLCNRLADLRSEVAWARTRPELLEAIGRHWDVFREADSQRDAPKILVWYGDGRLDDPDSAYARDWNCRQDELEALAAQHAEAIRERDAAERAARGLGELGSPWVDDDDEPQPPGAPGGDSGPTPAGQSGGAAALPPVAKEPSPTSTETAEKSPDRGKSLGERLKDAVETILADVKGKDHLAGLTYFSNTLYVGLRQRRGELGLGLKVIPVADLARPTDGGHEELLKRRFLCRGGAAVLVGPSGVGKSSFIMQASLLWSVGEPAFGIEPARPLRIIIFQAENDSGDMAEMRDGVLYGLADVLAPAQRDEAVKRVHTAHVTTITGDRVGAMLRDYARGFDLAVIDPLFAFVGGDLMKARDASHFLREVLAPVLIELDIGLILSHHTNKPPRGVEKVEWHGSDLAYLGAGSAELTNWPRGVVAIRSIGHDSIFELRAAKRGKRLEWKAADGNLTPARLIGHSSDGIIYWREVADNELPSVEESRTVAPTWTSCTAEAVEMAMQRVWKLGEFQKAIRESFGLSENAARPLQKFVEQSEGVIKLRGPNKGDAPLYLIGPEEVVRKEVARLKQEAQAARQGKLPS